MRIGIDLGGTKIEAIALDDDGSVILRERILAPRGDYDATLEAIAPCLKPKFFIKHFAAGALK